MENFAKKTKAELIAMLKERRDEKPSCRCDCDGSRDVVAALREIISMSCEDHCPHHRDALACKNCAIHQKLTALNLIG